MIVLAPRMDNGNIDVLEPPNVAYRQRQLAGQRSRRDPAIGLRDRSFRVVALDCNCFRDAGRIMADRNPKFSWCLR